MTLEELDLWATDFDAFHQRFAPYCCRSEPREEVRQYLRGLLAPVRRKNTWQMAEALGEAGPQRLQRLLRSAAWEADAVIAELQAFVIETFGERDAIAVLDESAFVKKGEHSVGVQRQWCGTLGKTENCQVGVFLAYVTPTGTVFLDRRLYLPEDWAADPDRRAAARVPEAVSFRTKGQLGQEMLEAAWARRVPMRWVTGDEVYGNPVSLRARIAQEGLRYVLAVAADTQVTPVGAATPQEVRQLAAGPGARWHRWSAGEGEKGPRLYDWAAVRVRFPGGEATDTTGWLLVRRSIPQPAEYAYYLSNASADTPLSQLVRVAGARWQIEAALKAAKGETGLDEYEVRYWQSWHRHETLSLLAHTFLVFIRHQARKREAEKKAGYGSAGSARRVDGCRGAPPPGGGAPLASRLPGSQAGLVPLAAEATPAGAAQPLPASGG